MVARKADRSLHRDLHSSVRDSPVRAVSRIRERKYTKDGQMPTRDRRRV